MTETTRNSTHEIKCPHCSYVAKRRRSNLRMKSLKAATEVMLRKHIERHHKPVYEYGYDAYCGPVRF